MAHIPRGIRNNNPLNIRIGNQWQGEVEDPTDPDFEQFKCMHYGLRAGFILLRRYIERYHLDNISAIISRWAPASENNTRHYIEVVSDMAEIGVLDRLDFNNSSQMIRRVDAMIYVENGQKIDRSIIGASYMIAHEGF